MEKLNIAELLKDCPKGMELDCVIFEDVYFDCIDQEDGFIKCYIQNNNYKTPVSFTEYGCYSSIEKSKCVIFPKGKTTWKGFQRPFKDGDVVAHQNNIGTWIGIYHRYDCPNTTFSSYCYLRRDGLFHANFDTGHTYYGTRCATEEEKEKLFKAIEDNGYKWNPKTNKLEKLIEPKFKVGDKVQWKEDIREKRIIDNVLNNYYTVQGYGVILFTDQDEWELVPNKFDITTLKPFERVLVRDSCQNSWTTNLYSHYMVANEDYHFATVFGYYRQCIPYESNEHLLGSTNDCDDFYKTWE